MNQILIINKKKFFVLNLLATSSILASAFIPSKKFSAATTQATEKKKTEYKISPQLEEAIRTHNLGNLQSLIDSKNINSEFAFGSIKPGRELFDMYTPLMFAAIRGFEEGVEYLLEKGANPNSKILHFYVNPNLSIAKRVNASVELGATPLMLSAIYPKKAQLAISELLIKYGANVNAVTLKGNTLLHIACKYADSEIQLQLIKLLVKSGANINAKNKEGLTPLDYVANSWFGVRNRIKNFLLSNGAERGKRFLWIF